MNLRNAIVTLLIPLFLIQSTVAVAGVEADFKSMLGKVNIQDSGSVKTQSRHVYYGGGASIRFGHSSVSFISFDPPTISAGCGGISAHFGGFSFISGEQIQKLIQNIGQAAMGYAVHLAIKTLCPQCQAVLNELQALAQFAAKMSTDSCTAAKTLVNKGAELFGNSDLGQELGLQNLGKEGMVVNNKVNDFMEAGAGALSQIRKELNDEYKKTKNGPPSAASPETKSVFQNTVWVAMEPIGFTSDFQKLLIMSMTGTSIYTGGNKDLKNACSDSAAIMGTPDSKQDPCVIHGPMSPAVVYTGLLCGLNPSATPINAAVTKPGLVADLQSELNIKINIACTNQALLPTGITRDAPMLECAPYPGDTANPYAQCLNVRHTTVGAAADNPFVIGERFFDTRGLTAFVGDALVRAVHGVMSGAGIPNDVVPLITMSPLPLYQLINISAVYPDLAKGILADTSIQLSQILTYSYVLRVLNKLGESPLAVAGDGERLNALLREIDKYGEVVKTEEHRRVMQTITMQQSMGEVIRSVNRALQAQVMTQRVLANHKFAVGISK